MTKKHISDVTLVMLGGSYLDLTEAALHDIFAKFTFDHTLVFTERPILLGDTGGKTSENIVMPMSSVADATHIAWREVYPRLRTNHILSTHWDGYPTNPDMWMEHYKDFDFIGPVWPWYRNYSVGNTGFSLQSKKLLAALDANGTNPARGCSYLPHLSPAARARVRHLLRRRERSRRFRR